MSIELNGTTGIDFNDGSNQSTAATPYGRKNLIINGDMRIAQRGTSETGITTSGYYTVDRWSTSYANPSATWTHSQDSDVPTGQGFANSFKILCTTSSAVGTNERLMVGQRFEGQNLQHLKKGTANAEPVTLSFWVKSNKTGTYIANLYDNDNTRSISKAYTINTANTWEKKTLTFDGDTTGALDNDNAQSFMLFFGLAVGTFETSGTLQTSWGSYVATDRFVGQVNLGDAVNNYINFTGVQLEVGDAASDFEFMPYDMELARCQRYYLLINGGGVAPGAVRNATNAYCPISFPVEMRSAPSATLLSAALVMPGDTGYTVTAIGLYNATTRTARLTAAIATSSLTSGYAVFLQAGTAITDGISFSSEL